MANEILVKNRSAITAQAAQGSAVAVGSYSSGTQTVVDNTIDGGSENSQGAFGLDIFFDVTIAGASNYAYADIYLEHSYDGSVFADPIYLLRSARISSSFTGLLYICRLYEIPPFLKLKWKPYSHTCDGAIVVIPQVNEVQ